MRGFDSRMKEKRSVAVSSLIPSFFAGLAPAKRTELWVLCLIYSCLNSFDICASNKCLHSAAAEREVVLYRSSWPTYYISKIDQHCCHSNSLFFVFTGHCKGEVFLG